MRGAAIHACAVTKGPSGSLTERAEPWQAEGLIDNHLEVHARRVASDGDENAAEFVSELTRKVRAHPHPALPPTLAHMYHHGSPEGFLANGQSLPCLTSAARGFIGSAQASVGSSRGCR